MFIKFFATSYNQNNHNSNNKDTNDAKDENNQINNNNNLNENQKYNNLYILDGCDRLLFNTIYER